MIIETVKDRETFRGLQEEWNGLLQRSSCRSVFLTWEWLYHWWAHFAMDKELHIILFREKGTMRLCGIAPFCREEVRKYSLLRIKKLKFLGTERVGSDFLDFIILPGYEVPVFTALQRYLAAERKLWDIIELSDIDQESPTPAYLRAHLKRGVGYCERPVSVCPYIRLPDNYDDFVKSLGMKMRQDLRRKTRRFEDDRAFAVSVSDGRGNAREEFDRLFALHGKGFRYQGHRGNAESSFRGEDIRRFHHDIVESFGARGWLKMYLVDHGTTRVGCVYAYRYKDCIFNYQTGFERRWDRWSIGTVVLGYCIRDSISQGVAEFHYLRGREKYKFRWTATAKKTGNVMLMNRTVGGLVCAGVEYGKTKARRILGKRGVRQVLQRGLHE